MQEFNFWETRCGDFFFCTIFPCMNCFFGITLIVAIISEAVRPMETIRAIHFVSIYSCFENRKDF